MSEQDFPLDRLVEELKKLPSIGAKTAQRIAFYLIGLPQEGTKNLAEAIKDAKKSTFYCSTCYSMTHVDPCQYCSDPDRNDKILCVVEEPFNISSIEKTGIYSGRYHVLLGTLSPLKGVGPDELKTEKLVKRIKEGNFEEIIIATNPTVEGESTAHYLAKILKDFNIKLTRLAMGLPVGSDIDYADQVTIKKAIEGRTEIKE
ncbi:MAG: recombination protein RecR [Candidatus Aminicenantes bacterium]|nr:recombination protein RecR [Candidatus Aminicenantes bacterium]MBL7084249.1 recombination protein RecR [Candidatus Aminicenantes bacterium]